MRIGITGATGFVGCRLAERLVLAGEYEVTGVIRRFTGSGLARLARLPVQLEQADLLDPAALKQALKGCDVVVNCAYGRSGTREEKYRATVEGSRNTAVAAREVGAARLVHLSSTGIHGVPREGTIDESTPAAPQTAYDRMKLDSEAELRAFETETGFPIVVLRPPLIYGPFGRRWTRAIVMDIAAGCLLVDDGRGSANFVYVDNLVDAILSAATTGRGDGKTYVIVDEELRTWRQVYDGYASLLIDAPPVESISVEEARRLLARQKPGMLHRIFVDPVRLAPQLLRAAVSEPDMRRRIRQVPWLNALANAVPESTRARLKYDHDVGSEITTPPKTLERRFPDEATLELMTSSARCTAHLARGDLGYRERIGWEAALSRIGDWIAYQRLVA